MDNDHDIVTQDLAQGFVTHRPLRLAPDRVTELALLSADTSAVNSGGVPATEDTA